MLGGEAGAASFEPYKYSSLRFTESCRQKKLWNWQRERVEERRNPKHVEYHGMTSTPFSRTSTESEDGRIRKATFFSRVQKKWGN